MTRHKATHTGLGTPSPLDRWINAMLRGLAMLVSHAAHLCSMRLIRHAPECHSEATPEVLPCRKSGKLKETTQAAACSYTRRAGVTFIASAMAHRSSKAREALMVSRPRSGRPSNPSRSEGRVARGGLATAASRGQLPLGKGRSEPAKLATGGAHFVPHPQLSLQRRLHEVTPTPTSLRTSRTSPFQGEIHTAPA